MEASVTKRCIVLLARLLFVKEFHRRQMFQTIGWFRRRVILSWRLATLFRMLSLILTQKSEISDSGLELTCSWPLK